MSQGETKDREMENPHMYARQTSKDVSLQELRDRLAEFAQVIRGWDQYHSPRNLLLALVIIINHASIDVIYAKGLNLSLFLSF